MNIAIKAGMMKSEAKFAGFVKVTPPVRLRVVVAGGCTSGSKTSTSPGGVAVDVPVVIAPICPV